MDKSISYRVHDGGQLRSRRDRPPPSVVSYVYIVEEGAGGRGRE
jgi:hypothetical protein